MWERRKTVLSPLAVLVAAGMLAGCAQRDSIIVGAVPDDYRTNHPIVVSEREKVLDLPVGILSYRMTPQQKQAIEGFLDDYGDSGPTLVTILVPDGSANAPAAARAAEDMAAFVQKEGVPKGYVQILPYRASPEQVAPVRLSYPRTEAFVASGPCGRWPADLLETHENKHYANFGCAYQNNLAAQVANPHDLLGPRGATPIDAENRDRAIADYRDGEVSDAFRSRSEVGF